MNNTSRMPLILREALPLVGKAVKLTLNAGATFHGVLTAADVREFTLTRADGPLFIDLLDVAHVRAGALS